MQSRRRNQRSVIQKTRRKCQFTQEHYQSNNGMLTTVWGPCMWMVLHTMSFNYPIQPTREQKHQYRDYILQLQHVLPCGKCRANLKKNFKKLPLKCSHMASRATFSKYVYDLHEIVNDMLGKKSGLTYDAVKDKFEHFRARCALSEERIRNENGCTEPLIEGVTKSKCVLKIVKV